VNNIFDNPRSQNMNKAVGVKIHKPGLKLVLCSLGIIIIIAILIAMRPLPDSKNAVTVSPGTQAKEIDNSGANLAAGQSALAVQSAAAVGQSTGLGDSAGPNSSHADSAASGAPSNANSPPITPSIPPAEPDAPLYPIDPIPCKDIYIRKGCGCETYLAPNGALGSCYTRCPGGGVEMMCAYPL
jgi:hypothetical protein